MATFKPSVLTVCQDDDVLKAFVKINEAEDQFKAHSKGRKKQKKVHMETLVGIGGIVRQCKANEIDIKQSKIKFQRKLSASKRRNEVTKNLSENMVCFDTVKKENLLHINQLKQRCDKVDSLFTDTAVDDYHNDIGSKQHYKVMQWDRQMTRKRRI